MRYVVPFVRPNQRVGLLGGSFDPPHGGHVHLSIEALKRLGLAQLWWLVSPANPLKAHRPTALAERMAAAGGLIRHPKVRISDIEAQIGTPHTACAIAALQARCPGVRFVWVMGADNLAQFHLWRDWRTIMARVPVAILARPGVGIRVRTAKAGRVHRHAMRPACQGLCLAARRPPRWCFINIPMKAISSSAIRARADHADHADHERRGGSGGDSPG
ncbi:MAG: nicotinate-nucleotide adenylyltransferase [Rhodobacteraceae bacterium]|nr:nicotinate-nucleotide adenylyltransferase [Paracoccaceae bacterium]